MNLKENSKKTFIEFKNMASMEIINLRTGNIKVGKEEKAAIAGSAALGTMLYGCSSVMAAEETIFERASSMMGSYYGTIFGLTTALAILLCLIAFLWAMLSPSGRGSEKAFGWAKRIILCWLVINCLGGILKVGENLTSGQNYTTTTKKG